MVRNRQLGRLGVLSFRLVWPALFFCLALTYTEKASGCISTLNGK